MDASQPRRVPIPGTASLQPYPLPTPRNPRRPIRPSAPPPAAIAEHHDAARPAVPPDFLPAAPGPPPLGAWRYRSRPRLQDRSNPDRRIRPVAGPGQSRSGGPVRVGARHTRCLGPGRRWPCEGVERGQDAGTHRGTGRHVAPRGREWRGPPTLGRGLRRAAGCPFPPDIAGEGEHAGSGKIRLVGVKTESSPAKSLRQRFYCSPVRV